MKPIFFLSLVVIGLAGCDDFYDCERGNKHVVTERLYVDDFSGIRLSMDADVDIRIGDGFYVEVEGEENIINRIETRVRDDIWRIRPDRCIRKARTLRFNITVPYIDEIYVSGSGNVTVHNTIVASFMRLDVSGSGDIDVSVACDNLDAEINGSGDIKVYGQTDDYFVDVSGSGDYYGFDLKSLHGEVRVSGSGTARVHADESLDIRVSGSGDVYYIGDAEVTSRVSGSGDVHNSN